jgi:hypothetical protein
MPNGKIDVALADQQLGLSLHPVIAAGARERLTNPAAVEKTSDPVAATQFLRARAMSATVDAERKRRTLNYERGKYILTDDAAAQWSQTLAALLLRVEESFADLALDLGLNREQLTVLRKWWRKSRGDAAAEQRRIADRLPEFVADEAA